MECEASIAGDAPSPLAKRFISTVQRAYKSLAAAPENPPEMLALLKKSFKGKYGRVYDINQGEFRMQGMMVQKGKILELTVVRIGMWDARRHDFLHDGEIPKDMGLKSGALFMKFSESLLLWALETKLENPELETMRLDAMSIRNPVLLPLLRALGFKVWPTDAKNYRLDLPFSRLTDGLPEFAAEPFLGSGT